MELYQRGLVLHLLLHAEVIVIHQEILPLPLVMSRAKSWIDILMTESNRKNQANPKGVFLTEITLDMVVEGGPHEVDVQHPLLQNMLLMKRQ